MPPGMHMVATTPVRTAFQSTNEETAVAAALVEHAVIGASNVSSILVFFMWVGAWGCVDILVQMVTNDPLYQLGLYFLLFAVCAVTSWFHMTNWRKAQDEIETSPV